MKWGQDKTGDSAKRSLAKAVLWRVFAASNTLICGVFLAKDLSVASKIAGTDTIFKTVSVLTATGAKEGCAGCISAPSVGALLSVLLRVYMWSPVVIVAAGGNRNFCGWSHTCTP